MSILIGDTNANGTVNAVDVAQIKSRLGQTVDATNFRSDVTAWPRAIADLAKRSVYLGLLGALQSHDFPQLHSLLSFIGQFLPVFLQLGLSAANETEHIAAIRIENRIFA